MCNICYNVICDERRGYYKLKNEKEIRSRNRKCIVCGILKEGISRRYKDRDGKWDGRSYICDDCYGKMWYNDIRRPERKYLTAGYEEYDKDYLGLLGECIIAAYLDRNCNTCDILSLNRHKPCELEHKDYGTIDVKSSRLYYNDKWGS